MNPRDRSRKTPHPRPFTCRTGKSRRKISPGRRITGSSARSVKRPITRVLTASFCTLKRPQRPGERSLKSFALKGRNRRINRSLSLRLT